MEKELRILVLEDSPIDAELTYRELTTAQMNCSFRRVATKKKFVSLLEEFLPDAILADYTVPQFGGLEALRLVKEMGVRLPFILVTGTQREEVAVECMKEGADDYILKSSLKRLPGALMNAIEKHKAEQDRHRLEDELQKSVKQALTIFESITDIFIAIDRDWRMMYLNPPSDTFLAKLGKKRENLWGQDWWEEFGMDADGMGAGSLRRAMGDGAPVEFEEYFPGLESWLSVRAYPNEDGLSLYAQDITEKKHTQQILDARERRFRAIIENSLDGFALVDAHGIIQYVSPSSVEILGYEEAEQIGSDILEHIHAEDLPAIETKLKKALREKGSTFHCEYRTKHKNGSWRWIEVVGKNMLGDEVVTALVMNYRDVTDRRRSAEQLALQATVLNEVNDAIISVDQKFRITSWNRAAEEMYGWQVDEVLGKELVEVVETTFDDMSFDQFRDILRTAGVWNGEAAQCARDGHEIIVQMSSNKLFNTSGQPIGFVSILHDVTEKKRLEQQFLRAQRLESIGTLAGGIAHDLNNVFTPILMAIPMMKDEIEKPRTLDILDALEVSAKRGERIVRQVLSFARGLKGEKSAIYLKHIVGEVTDLLRETLSPNINLEVRNAKDVMPVLGDTTQLYQVMMNLAVNARDAMPDGGTLRFETKNAVVDENMARHFLQAHPGPYVELSVSDSGSGIDQSVLDKIFDPFFTTKEHGKGTGLGLSTVLSIVKGHGGFIDVQSSVGKGTMFKVYLPVAQSEVAKEESIASKIPQGEGQVVLVVDDEEVVTSLIHAALQTSNYKVLTAKDGTEAVAVYAEHREKISAVLLDMLMPHMDGSATLRVIQKMDPEARVMLMSGRLVDDQEEKGRPVNGVPFLQKPFTIEQLLKRVAELIYGESALYETA